MSTRVVDAIQSAHQSNGRIIVLENGRGWLKPLLQHDPEGKILFAIWPDPEKDEWKIQAVPKDYHTISYRAMIPPAMFTCLQGVRKVDSNGVMAGVKTRREAILYAKIAVAISQRSAQN